jgi:hypothetical protein
VFTPELEVPGYPYTSSGITVYCPVPDNTAMPVATINTVFFAGRGSHATGSGARGCVQFNNNYGQACLTGFTTFPAADFADFPVPAPSNWSEWWNNAYLEVRLQKGSTWPALRRMLAQN